MALQVQLERPIFTMSEITTIRVIAESYEENEFGRRRKPNPVDVSKVDRGTQTNDMECRNFLDRFPTDFAVVATIQADRILVQYYNSSDIKLLPGSFALCLEGETRQVPGVTGFFFPGADEACRDLYTIIPKPNSPEKSIPKSHKGVICMLDPKDKGVAYLRRLGHVLLDCFQVSSNFQEIRAAVELYQLAMLKQPSHWWLPLGYVEALKAKAQKLDNPHILDPYIAQQRKFLSQVLAKNWDISSVISTQVAALFVAKFELSSNPHHIDEAIKHLREAVQSALVMGDLVFTAIALWRLGRAVKSKFDVGPQVALGDMEETIALHKSVLQSMPADHSRRSQMLLSLGELLQQRFVQWSCNSAVDIDEALVHLLEAERLDPTEPIQRKLAHTLTLKHAHFPAQEGSPHSDALAYYHKALEHPTLKGPEGIELRHNTLHEMGHALLRHYSITADYSYLERAIETFRNIMDDFPEHDPQTLVAGVSLGRALHQQYGYKSDEKSFTEALALLRNAVKHLPKDRVDLYAIMIETGSALLTAFYKSHDRADAEDAISHYATAEKLVPDGDRVKLAAASCHVGSALIVRYSLCAGDRSDLDEAIVRLTRGIAELRESDNTDLVAIRNNLASALLYRYNLTRRRADLDDSIQLYQVVLQRLKPGHIERPTVLRKLLEVLRIQIEHLELPAERDTLEATAVEVIQRTVEVVDLIPKGSPHFTSGGIIEDMAGAYICAYHLYPDRDLLDFSIAIYKIPDRSSQSMYNLCSALELKARSLMEEERAKARLPQDVSTSASEHVIDEAIPLLQDLLQLLVPGDYRVGPTMRRIGDMWYMKYQVTRNPEARERALECLSLAAGAFHTGTSCAYDACRRWITVTEELQNVQDRLKAYDQMMTILPRIAYLDQDVAARLEALRALGPMATDAASIAVGNSMPEKAVEYLEAGRSVFWNTSLLLRTPATSIPQHLIPRFTQVTQALEVGSHAIFLGVAQTEVTLAARMEHSRAHQRQLAQEFDNVLEEIRRLPGQHNFLRPPSYKDMTGVSQYGTVVILGEDTECFALIMDPKRSSPTVLPLGTLTRDLLGEVVNLWKRLNGQGRFRDGDSEVAERPAGPRKSASAKDLYDQLLTLLWVHVAKPVIESLNIEVRVMHAARRS